MCEEDGGRRGGGRGGEGKRFILSIMNHLYPPGSIVPQYHHSANPIAVPIGSTWTRRQELQQKAGAKRYCGLKRVLKLGIRGRC